MERETHSSRLSRRTQLLDLLRLSERAHDLDTPLVIILIHPNSNFSQSTHFCSIRNECRSSGLLQQEESELTIKCTRESLTDSTDQLAQGSFPFRTNFRNRRLTSVELLLSNRRLLLQLHDLSYRLSASQRSRDTRSQRLTSSFRFSHSAITAAETGCSAPNFASSIACACEICSTDSAPALIRSSTAIATSSDAFSFASLYLVRYSFACVYDRVWCALAGDDETDQNTLCQKRENDGPAVSSSFLS